MNQSRRVLLIEDDRDAAQTVALMLQQAQPALSVDICSDLATGLEMAGQWVYDIALLDLTLPDATGLTTLQAFRRAYPALPVVVLSGDGDDKTIANALSAGAYDYLVKGRYASLELIRVVTSAAEMHGNNLLKEEIGQVVALVGEIRQEVKVIRADVSSVRATVDELVRKVVG